MIMNNLSLVFGYTIIILLCVLITSFSCQRRIEDGTEVTADKKYAVYLVRAVEESPQLYDEWICGGAIVSEYYVVTSAACVQDVKHLYIISGYNRYVKDDDIDKDPCTKEMKKRVVYTCIPLSYDFDYYRIEKWSNIDIALVKVDEPFNFKDKRYEEKCSYIPEPIKINYENEYQQPDRDAMVLGWGHKKIYRKPENTDLLNSPKLNYAPVKLTEKEVCKKAYSKFDNMSKIIDMYMLCTEDRGNIDDKGDTISTSAPIAEGCGPDILRMGGKCEDKNDEYAGLLDTRKSLLESLLNRPTLINNSNIYEALLMSSNFRRAGICQNDHGGPLVTWVGTHEILIGIASVFLISSENECEGPYLFTSTQCNGAFLHCMLTKHNSKGFRRFDFCDIPESERDYNVLENHIQWKSHTNWTAANETKVANSTEKETFSTASTNKTETISITTSKTVDNVNATYRLMNQTKENIHILSPVINNTTTLETHKAETIIDGTPKPINQTKENITATITPEINKTTIKEIMLTKPTIG